MAFAPAVGRRATSFVLLLVAGILAGGPGAGPARAADGTPLPGPVQAGAPPRPAPEVREPPLPPPEPPPLAFPEEGVIERPDGTIVFFYRTNFVNPAELKTSLTKLVEVPGVKLTEFPQQNILLIEGTPEAVSIALDAAAYFDVAMPQVFIEAKVIEITYDSNFEFGLDYLWSREQTGPNTLFRGAEAILNPTSFIASTLPGGLPFQGTSLLFGFVGQKAEQFGLLDVTLQALQMDGKAEVLSKPSIICTQGKEAKVVTSEDRFIAQFQGADLTQVRYQAGTLTTGVSLIVTAIHIGENFVTLDIAPEVKGVQGLSATGAATLRPVSTMRSAKTQVTMADGETLVIGGLYTNASIRSKAKTPLISDIPILGELFTRTQEAKAKTELIFMLTPRIVRRTADLKVIAPPAELERLEAKEECWRPAGPSLRCPTEYCPPSGAAAPARRPAGGAPAPLPPPVVTNPGTPPAR